MDVEEYRERQRQAKRGKGLVYITYHVYELVCYSCDKALHVDRCHDRKAMSDGARKAGWAQSAGRWMCPDCKRPWILKRCPDCDGSGLIPYEEPGENNGITWTTRGSRPCKGCGGGGRLKVAR